MSVGEREITRRISLVAVCCPRVSVRSRFRTSSSWNSRTFSIAITAWSAKVLSNAICLSENGNGVPHLWSVIAPIGTPSRSIGTGQQSTEPGGVPQRLQCVLRVLTRIRNVDRPAGHDRPAGRMASMRPHRIRFPQSAGLLGVGVIH
jgi:hypothetical protein